MTIIPPGVGGPGRHHARPLPLPPHNGQHLVDPLLSSAGEREGECVATAVTDFWSLIHLPRPRPGVGVDGMAGFYDVPKASADDILRDTSTGEDEGADCSRDTSVADGDIETETEGSYDAASSQLSRDEDGDDGPPSLPTST